MSIKIQKVLVCDGCGTTIDMDFYIRIQPAGQRVLQLDASLPVERDFCCEACEVWWQAQYPASGPWGPAWEEREWWAEQAGPEYRQRHLRTTHSAMPLVDTHAHFEDPEPTGT
jgi:hypothetical protein